MPNLSSDYLTDFSTKIFQACGVPADEALIVAENLVETTLLGFDSHGVVRIPQYVDAILDGQSDGAIKPGGEITIENDRGSTAVVDCGCNFGQVGGVRAMELAIKKATEHGISCVMVKNCNHAGRLGAFTQMAAEAGMVALATCNSPKHGHWVAPFGGKEGRLATNPFAFSAPTKGDPVVFDMSTSAISEGAVRLCHNKGIPAPADCINDAQGQTTTDPNDFYAEPKGTIKPFGGSAGYKGTGLGLMVEMLSGTLKGDLITDGNIIGNGLCLIVINIANFVEPERFDELANSLVEYVRSSAPVDESTKVQVPGEPNFTIRRDRLENGIEIDDSNWNQIMDIAKKLNVE